MTTELKLEWLTDEMERAARDEEDPDYGGVTRMCFALANEVARAAVAADPGRARMEAALREMISASAACLRVIASAGRSKALQAELVSAGVKDGFGIRAQTALESLSLTPSDSGGE